MGLDPRQLGLDLRRLAVDLKRLGPDLRRLVLGPRLVGPDPRLVGFDPIQSVIDCLFEEVGWKQSPVGYSLEVLDQQMVLAKNLQHRTLLALKIGKTSRRNDSNLNSPKTIVVRTAKSFIFQF